MISLPKGSNLRQAVPHDDSTAAQLAVLRKEREFYLRLLSLGHQQELEAFLKEALGLLVDVAEMRQGYLELYDEDGRASEARWWTSHGFSSDEISQVRAQVSRGIIDEALAQGGAIDTTSAIADPRFEGRESVRVKRINAVLCVPIGDDPPRGVLYLQGRARGAAFSAEERARAELFVQHLAPFVDRIVARTMERDTGDPTREYREKLRLDGVVGRSTALAKVLRLVALAAPLDVTVLLTGDTGTGKTPIARAIHDNSPRAERSFVELNCAGISKDVFETEMFGIKRGIATGIDRDRDGVFALARGGTLFLDEIGEIPMSSQASLLQVLQSGSFRPVGHEAPEPLEANVRIIAATNIDLDRAVAEKQFRDDLRARLDVMSLRLPSLEERREDIAELAAHFCDQVSEKHKLPRVELSRGARRALEAAPWPRNIRQLANSIEKALIACVGEGGQQIEASHLFPQTTADEPAGPVTLQSGTQRFQAQLLRDTLTEVGWNVSEAARRLDISHAHIHRLLKAYGIERGQR